jgi:hypothetical protein
MTTSGTAVFTVTRDDVIGAALRSLKVIADGQTIGTNDLTNCALALNLLLKGLATEGYLPWLYQTISFTLTATTASYTIAESGAAVTAYRPLRIASAYRRDASTPPNDIPLSPLSRQEYEQTTPKTMPGYPTSYYYDPQLTAGIFYVWPVPADATQTARLLVERPVQDITGATQNFDLPQEWFLPLRWILADEVSEEYELDDATIKRIAARAKYWREKIADFSREEASVLFQPNQQVLQRGLR